MLLICLIKWFGIIVIIYVVVVSEILSWVNSAPSGGSFICC